ncbi:MAG: aminoglycoside phosphotransferase family protein [Planctomycetota bacterium]
MTQTPHPSPEITAFASELLQHADLTFRFCGWPHAVSRVWEVTSTQQRCFLKQHSQPRKFVSELNCYQEILPALQRNCPELGSCTPQLIGASAPLATLVIAACDGDVVATQTLADGDELECHRRAGAFCQAFHSLPHDDADPLPLADALMQRLNSWLEQGRDVIAPADRLWAAEQFDAASWAHSTARVFCHRDYQPRNWLVAGSGDALQWHCIDFEHTLPDCWLFDCIKLWDRSWRDKPDLRDAFFDGYGRALTAQEDEALLRLGILHAVSTLTWGHLHRDVEFERHGRSVFERLYRIL